MIMEGVCDKCGGSTTYEKRGKGYCRCGKCSRITMNDRQLAVCQWAKSHLDAKDFCILDTETTGLDHTAEVVSIAIVNAWGRVAFSSLCRPRDPIDVTGRAYAVNGISNSMVKDAPLFRDAWQIAFKHIQCSTVIAYNADFDCRMIAQNLTPHDCWPFRDFWECTMLQYSAYNGELGQYGDLKWHKLSAACAHMGIQARDYHDALSDALATYDLMKVLASKVE